MADRGPDFCRAGFMHRDDFTASVFEPALQAFDLRRFSTRLSTFKGNKNPSHATDYTDSAADCTDLESGRIAQIQPAGLPAAAQQELRLTG